MQVIELQNLSLQVADLDDEFADLVLEEFSENFDLLPAEKVNFIIQQLWQNVTNWMQFDFSAFDVCAFFLNFAYCQKAVSFKLGETLS